MVEMMQDLILDLYSDPALKERFMADPASVMKEHGVVVPEGVDLCAVEDTAEIRHIVLPYIAPGAAPKLEEIEQRASKIII
jgi:hypothetical protein